MNVALYYPWVYLTSGSERTILELTGRSRHDWTIYTSRFEPENTFPALSERNIQVLSPVSVRRSVTTTAINCAKLLTQRLPMERHDALVVVCEGLGDLVVFRNSSKPTLCVCLTPLRIAFDSVYRERSLRSRGLPGRWAVRAGAALFRLVDRLAWRRYSRVVAISGEARRRAVEGGLPHSQTIEILHPGTGFSPPAPSDDLGDFFLVPGRIMWTKNIELAVRAFSEFRRSHPQFRLVIAGMVDRKSEVYLSGLRELAEGVPGVEFHLTPSDAELARLYSQCRAVLFTAFNEDWGIVPIEAMAFGKPVVAVNSGGPTESVLHGRTGFLEPPEPAAFAGRMAELAADRSLASRLGRAGRDRSKLYSWQRFASRIDDCIDQLCLPPATTDVERLDTPLAGTGPLILIEPCDLTAVERQQQ